MKSNKSIRTKLHSIIIPPGCDIRIGAFNILAVCGAFVSLITGICNWIFGFNIAAVVVCLACVVVSAALMLYARKTGNFRRAMILTVVIIFLVFLHICF